jgi:ABC-type dipeptide/oligopeptide/nickel transport system ATPase component
MALELIDVSLSLSARPLVAGLSARVEPGQVLTLMGESGCGKSIWPAACSHHWQPAASYDSMDASSNGCRSNSGRSACCSRTTCCFRI